MKISQNNRPIISIVVPVYNKEIYFQRCIDSILAQTLKNIEIILINDGSTDSSLEICKKYEMNDKRIILIDKPNGGVSSARNAGIKKASADWITFIDADDYVSNTYIESMANMLDEKIDIVLSSETIRVEENTSRTNNLGVEAGIYTSFKDILIPSKGLTKGEASGPFCKLFNRAKLNKINLLFDETVHIAEDFLFNIEYLLACKTFAVSEGGIYYYNTTTPNSLVKTILNGASLIPPVQKLLEKFDEIQFDSEVKNILHWRAVLLFQTALASIYKTKIYTHNERLYFLSQIKNEICIRKIGIAKCSFKLKFSFVTIRYFNINIADIVFSVVFTIKKFFS